MNLYFFATDEVVVNKMDINISEHIAIEKFVVNEVLRDEVFVDEVLLDQVFADKRISVKGVLVFATLGRRRGLCQ